MGRDEKAFFMIVVHDDISANFEVNKIASNEVCHAKALLFNSRDIILEWVELWIGNQLPAIKKLLRDVDD